MIEQASRRRDNHAHAAPQRIALIFHTRAADEAHAGKFLRRKLPVCFFDLRNQFACRSNH
jgi:hypothetical protein